MKVASELTNLLYFFVVNIIEFGVEFVQLITTKQSFSTIFRKDTTIDPLTFTYTKDYIITPEYAILIQIVIGAISDRFCSKYGKRRVFVVFGCICFEIFYFVCFLSTTIAYIYVSQIHSFDESLSLDEDTIIYSLNIVYHLFSTFSFISLNIMRIAYRAFILDEFDSQFQMKVYTMSAVASGSARLLFSIISLILSFINVYAYDKINPIHFPIVHIILQLLSLIVIPLCTLLFWKHADETSSLDFDETTSFTSSINEKSSLFNSIKISQQLMKSQQLRVSRRRYISNELNQQNEMKKTEKFQLKELIKYIKEIIQDIWKMIISSKVDFRIIFFVAYLGWFCVFSLSEHSILLSLLLMANCSTAEITLSNSFVKLAEALTILITCIVMFIIKQKKLYRSFVVSFLIAAVSFCTVFLVTGKEELKCFQGMENWTLLFTNITLIVHAIIYPHLMSLPYSLLRNTIIVDKFGLATSLINAANSLGYWTFRIIFKNGSFPNLQFDFEHINQYFHIETVQQIQHCFVMVICLCVVTSIVSRMYKFVGNLDKDVIRKEHELQSMYMEFGLTEEINNV